MKSLVSKGGRPNCNKNAINTFLHKWSDLHRLWHTLKIGMAKETSLVLDGGAYKCQMSIPKSICPTSWVVFEALFRKEFLPHNENRHNQMHGINVRWNFFLGKKILSLQLSILVRKNQVDVLHEEVSRQVEVPKGQCKHQKCIENLIQASSGFSNIKRDKKCFQNNENMT